MAKKRTKKSNPSPVPVGKWVKATKVKVNRNGTVSAMVPASSLKKNPRRNVAAGFFDEDGIFHPIRASFDYSRGRVGEKPKKAKAKRKAAKRKR